MWLTLELAMNLKSKQFSYLSVSGQEDVRVPHAEREEEAFRSSLVLRSPKEKSFILQITENALGPVLASKPWFCFHQIYNMHV